MSAILFPKKGISLYALVTFTLFAYIYAQYLGGLNRSGLPSTVSIYVIYTFWLHFLLLSVLGGLLVSVLHRLLSGSPGVYRLLVALIASVLTLYLYLDSKIYSTINLHISPFVIEAMLQEDALQHVGISVSEIAQSNWPLLLLLGVHLFITPLSKIRLYPVAVKKNGVVVFLLVLLVGVVIDKLLFSYLYYMGQPIVFQLRDTPPAYLTPDSYHIRRVFSFVLGDDSRVNFTQPLEKTADASKISAIEYPAGDELTSLHMKPKFNIVLVVAESLREQDVDSTTAPFYTRLASEAIHASNHYTSGNCTHFGLFSLLYGLNPYHFHDFRMTLKPPATISTLRNNGYTIYSTAAQSMRWYDLDKFLLGKDPVSFLPAGGKNYERDRMVTDRSIEIARKHHESGKPYFNFLYYYTTHADYEHPKMVAEFGPEIKGRVDFSDNYLKGKGREKLLNRYRNAIRYVDSELERLVTAIREIGAWENTILIYTSDHGEEFFEEDTFGHNTNLNSYQTRVPLLMHIPGKGAVAIERLTSHMDVMQTLFGVIIDGGGLDNIPFHGRDMLVGEPSVVYIAKAHFQRPTAYAIFSNEYKAFVKLEGGFLEVESVSAGKSDKAGVVSREVKKDVVELMRQMRELKNTSTQKRG